MNRFLLKTDPVINWNLPSDWWSRPYEYYFAMNTLCPTDHIIDAGCGGIHPFKYKAAKICSRVYAVDSSPELLEYHKNISTPDNLELKLGDITHLSEIMQGVKVDKVYCISVLEHIPENLEKCLKEFHACIKSDGKIILTIDYPTLKPEILCRSVYDAGLVFEGEIDYGLKENMVTDIGLHVYTAILKPN